MSERREIVQRGRVRWAVRERRLVLRRRLRVEPATVAGSDNVVQGTLGQTDEDGREKDEGCNPINTAALLAHVKS